jgi:hypothetical protein
VEAKVKALQKSIFFEKENDDMSVMAYSTGPCDKNIGCDNSSDQCQCHFRCHASFGRWRRKSWSLMNQDEPWQHIIANSIVSAQGIICIRYERTMKKQNDGYEPRMQVW